MLLLIRTGSFVPAIFRIRLPGAGQNIQVPADVLQLLRSISHRYSIQGSEDRKTVQIRRITDCCRTEQEEYPGLLPAGCRGKYGQLREDGLLHRVPAHGYLL